MHKNIRKAIDRAIDRAFECVPEMVPNETVFKSLTIRTAPNEVDILDAELVVEITTYGGASALEKY